MELAEKAAYLIPQPCARVRDTQPQTFQQITADFSHIAEIAAERVNNSRDDLRYSLNYLNDYGREVFNQRNEQLNTRRDKLRDCSYHRVNNA